jgi:hypothetical protein
MTTERVRTTISLTPEALAIFKRMAEAGNMSISRCMGDWLVDTADAAEMLTLKMEEAKRAPLRVMAEMRAMVAGMGLEIDEIQDDIRERRRSDRAAAGGPALAGPPVVAQRAGAVVPPSGNTGVLVPPMTKNKSKMTTPTQGKKYELDNS